MYYCEQWLMIDHGEARAAHRAPVIGSFRLSIASASTAPACVLEDLLLPLREYRLTIKPKLIPCGDSPTGSFPTPLSSAGRRCESDSRGTSAPSWNTDTAHLRAVCYRANAHRSLMPAQGVTPSDFIGVVITTIVYR